MGKGNRARIQRAQDKLDTPQYVAEKKQAPKWAGTAIVIFIVVILALSLTLNALYDSGAMMRSSAAMKSENYTVSGTMLSYFYNSQYMSFMNTYGNLVSYLGIDPNTSLKTQACSMLSDGGTWFDYFMNTTEAYVSELLLCCEYAKANGIELDDEDKAEIDSAIEALAETAFEVNRTLNSYISAAYGSGVKEKDVRNAMEMILLSNKAAIHANEKFEGALTEEEIQKYYDENPASFLSADYMVKSFEVKLVSVDKDDYDTTEAYDQAVADAKASYETNKADALAKAEKYESLSGFDAFLDKLNADITEEYTGYYNYDENLTVEERIAKEKSAIATALENASVEGYAYQDPAAEDSDELAKWIFADGRKVGDIKLIEEEDETAGTYKVHVYCVSSTVSREEYTTVNMAYAMFPTSESASSLVADELKTKLAGVTTREAFEAAMADQSSSGAGVIEDLRKGAFGYDEVDEYVYADGRVAGDCEVINCGTTYVAVVVYLGEGDVAWHAAAKDGVLNEKLSAWYEELAATFTVDINEKALNKISA